MDSSQKPATSDPAPKMPAPPASTINPDATLRTADVDATLRTPDPPVAVPAGDVTIRLPNQPAAESFYDATVRMTSQQAARMVPLVKTARTHSSWQAWVATPAFAVVSVMLALGIGVYAFRLNSKLTVETAQREQLEASLQQQTAQIAALQELLTKAQGQQKTSEEDANRLRARLAAQEQETVKLSAALAQRDELLVFLQSADVKAVALAGSDKAKSASGLLLYDPGSKKAFFYGFNLPPLQRGKAYQLWAIVDRPVNAGIFSVDSGRKGRMVTQPLPDFPHIRQFVVSVEPEGGLPQPTGAIHLISRR